MFNPYMPLNNTGKANPIKLMDAVCHDCSRFALERVLEPECESTTRYISEHERVALTFKKLMAGQLLERMKCVRHAKKSLFAVMLCPCGEQAAHEVLVKGSARPMFRRLKDSIWPRDHRDGRYSLCETCVERVEGEVVAPWRSSRRWQFSHDSGLLLGKLMRRAKVIAETKTDLPYVDLVMKTSEASPLQQEMGAGGHVNHFNHFNQFNQFNAYIVNYAGTPTPADVAGARRALLDYVGDVVKATGDVLKTLSLLESDRRNILNEMKSRRMVSPEDISKIQQTDRSIAYETVTLARRDEAARQTRQALYIIETGGIVSLMNEYRPEEPALRQAA